MNPRGLKEKGLRLKFFLLSAFAVAASLSLIGFLMNDEIGRSMMHDDGWPMLGMLVVIAVVGLALMFYLATPSKPPPTDSEDKGQEEAVG
jgi:hypothetical protein